MAICAGCGAGPNTVTDGGGVADAGTCAPCDAGFAPQCSNGAGCACTEGTACTCGFQCNGMAVDYLRSQCSCSARSCRRPVVRVRAGRTATWRRRPAGLRTWRRAVAGLATASRARGVTAATSASRPAARAPVRRMFRWVDAPRLRRCDASTTARTTRPAPSPTRRAAVELPPTAARAAGSVPKPAARPAPLPRQLPAEPHRRRSRSGPSRPAPARRESRRR